MNKFLSKLTILLCAVFVTGAFTVEAQRVKPTVTRACSKPCPGPLKPARQLNILLINDDSITDNVIALRQGLLDAGHNVYTFLPGSQASASGAGFLVDSYILEEVDTNAYLLSANPAAYPEGCDKVPTPNEVQIFAKSYMFRELGVDHLDLCVSGINEGANTGASWPVSGTTSGALCATWESVPYFKNTPALAFSMDAADEERLALAVQFVVNITNYLDTHRNGQNRLLPLDTCLNINIPTVNWPLFNETGEVEMVDIKGVTLNKAGRYYSKAANENTEFTYLEQSGNVSGFITPEAGGYISGPNGFGDLAQANRYETALYTGNTISSVQLGLFNRPEYRSGSKNYSLTFRISESDASGTTPTTVLAQRVLNVADIIFTPGENNIELAIVSLDTLNVDIDSITSDYFFISVDFSDAYQFASFEDVYLVGLFLTIPFQSVSENRAYNEFSDETWVPYNNPSNWGFNGDLWINPLLCSNLDPQDCNYVNNAQNPSVPYSLEGEISYLFTSLIAPALAPDVCYSDNAALAAGYITIVPLSLVQPVETCWVKEICCLLKPALTFGPNLCKQFGSCGSSQSVLLPVEPAPLARVSAKSQDSAKLTQIKEKLAKERPSLKDRVKQLKPLGVNLSVA